MRLYLIGIQYNTWCQSDSRSTVPYIRIYEFNRSPALSKSCWHVDTNVVACISKIMTKSNGVRIFQVIRPAFQPFTVRGKSCSCNRALRLLLSQASQSPACSEVYLHSSFQKWPILEMQTKQRYCHCRFHSYHFPLLISSFNEMLGQEKSMEGRLTIIILYVILVLHIRTERK